MNLKRLYNTKNLYNYMKKPWILDLVLKEMTDGFYLDINNQISTEILDSNYRWRGVCISNDHIYRSNLCTVINVDINNEPKRLFSTLNTVMVGNVIHFMSVKNINNLELMFDEYYKQSIYSNFEKTKYYWRKQIITLEILSEVPLSKTLIDKLNSYFYLELINEENGNYKFVNSLYKILIN